jgi:hypothetical protein
MFQDWMRPRFTKIVEDATGRNGTSFLLAGRARSRPTVGTAVVAFTGERDLMTRDKLGTLLDSLAFRKTNSSSQTSPRRHSSIDNYPPSG